MVIGKIPGISNDTTLDYVFMYVGGTIEDVGVMSTPACIFGNLITPPRHCKPQNQSFSINQNVGISQKKDTVQQDRG